MLEVRCIIYLSVVQFALHSHTQKAHLEFFTNYNPIHRFNYFKLPSGLFQLELWFIIAQVTAEGRNKKEQTANCHIADVFMLIMHEAKILIPALALGLQEDTCSGLTYYCLLHSGLLDPPGASHSTPKQPALPAPPVTFHEEVFCPSPSSSVGGRKRP